MNNPYMMYPNQFVPYQNQQNQINQLNQTPQIQNGGLMIARSIEDAQRYPVAPGTCVTFKIENEKMICEKIMGFSNLEQPVFKKYRLEEIVDEPTQEEETYALKSDLESLQNHLAELEKKYGNLEELDRKIETLRRTKVIAKPQEVTANA